MDIFYRRGAKINMAFDCACYALYCYGGVLMQIFGLLSVVANPGRRLFLHQRLRKRPTRTRCCSHLFQKTTEERLTVCL